MFNDGSRVILIASSCNRATGPRKGSVGFTSSKIKIALTLKIKNILCRVVRLDVYFTRYGFEQRSRLERKEIFAVTPIVKRDEIKDSINDLSKALAEGNINEIEKGTNISVGPKHTFAIVAPLINNDFNLMGCDSNNLAAWLSCVAIRNTLFHRDIVIKSHVSKFKDVAFRNQSLWMLLHSLQYKDPRSKILEDMLVNDNFRSLVITAVRVYQTMTTNTNTMPASVTVGEDFNLAFFKSLFEHEDLNRIEIFSQLINYMFRRTFSDKLIKIAGTFDNPQLNSLVQDFEAMSDELVLSACILENEK